jgi:hypothetical protein
VGNNPTHPVTSKNARVVYVVFFPLLKI